MTLEERIAALEAQVAAMKEMHDDYIAHQKEIAEYDEGLNSSETAPAQPRNTESPQS